MTHDYKEIWDEFVKRNGEQGFFAEAIRHALTLAAEYERVKKERDELAEIILEADDALNTLFGEEANVLAKKVMNENGNA